MNRKLIPLFLALILLMGTLVALHINAEEQIVLPSACYDLSTGAALQVFKGSNNLAYDFTEGSHTTFTAMGSDPQMMLDPPIISTSDAKYLCIEYRTQTEGLGEMYVARTDGVSMSQDPTSHLEWTYTADGEWHRLPSRRSG